MSVIVLDLNCEGTVSFIVGGLLVALVGLRKGGRGGRERGKEREGGERERERVGKSRRKGRREEAKEGGRWRKERVGKRYYKVEGRGGGFL